MKSFFLIIATLMLSFSAFAGRTYISLSNTTLTNVDAVSNADGSVTYSLIDAGTTGTVRFNDFTDFTPYQSVVFAYSQTASNGVTYSLNNQYINNPRATYKPASTLTGSGSFDVVALSAAGKAMDNSYYALQITSGTVTISSIYCTSLPPTGAILLNTLDYNNNGTIAKTTVNTSANINGSAKPQIAGPNTTSANTYVDLTAYELIKFDIYYPTANEGTEISIRFQFVNSDGTGVTGDSDAYTIVKPTGSGTVSFSLKDAQLPSKKLTGIKAFAASGVAFTLSIDNIYVFVNDTPTSIQQPNVDEVPAFVNVYDISGQILKSNVPYEQALQGLAKGIYIVNKKKVAVY